MRSIKSRKIVNYLLLYFSFLIYSLSSVAGKFAALYEFLSIKFIEFYVLSLLILVIYAVLWQIILKRFDLVTAYANRPVVTIMGVIWGACLFNEKITVNMIIGSIIILIGIRLVAIDEK